MGYTTAAEDAARIRAAYKELGWSNRKVSVRAENYSMGSSIHVTIKHPDVDEVKAKEIAEGAERIRRCEMTHEILSGGNRFVHVRYSDEAKAAIAEPFEARVSAAIDEAMERSEGSHVEVPGTDVTFAKVHAGMVQLWNGDRPGYQFHASPGDLARGNGAAFEVGRIVKAAEREHEERQHLGTVEEAAA